MEKYIHISHIKKMINDNIEEVGKLLGDKQLIDDIPDPVERTKCEMRSKFAKELMTFYGKSETDFEKYKKP